MFRLAGRCPEAREGYLAVHTRLQAPQSTVHINKIAGASRLLDTAIRLFFAKEDELAIHLLASSAFRVLRDLTKKRGKNFTAEVLRNGICSMARQYAEGKLPKAKLKLIEKTGLMVVIKRILDDERAQGGKFELSRIDVRMNGTGEQRAWPSHAANFLKHADHRPDEHLAVDEIRNEHVLIGACTAYLELMKTPTPEITAFVAFWAVKNDADVGEEVQELLLKLRSVEEPARHRLCAKFIQDWRPE
jgi:hypothetical protein